MQYGIGIDTGGTYTDAVIYDFHNHIVIDSAKELTTHDDLTTGIVGALQQLQPGLLAKVELVSLSTTLATNACVENKGGRAKLLFLGVDPRVVDWVGKDAGLHDSALICHIPLASGSGGETVAFPDWSAFLAERGEWLRDADALGIVELNAMDNQAIYEKNAKQVISQRYSMPIICGYELFDGLNAIKRGASALLNGRLIPVLAEFLEAIRAALLQLGITAPVSIVRSDGGLMSETFTGARPVETILCGPAASVSGCMAMAKDDDVIVVDMGGTTTDIAMIRDGMPVQATSGIEIGGWQTTVKGVYVKTLGLGGDSAVRYDSNQELYLDTTRVIPLCIAATRWRGISQKLETLLAERGRHTLPLYEFLVLQKSDFRTEHYSQQERALCQALAGGPLSYLEAAQAVGADPYCFEANRLEREGIIIRCGLTPTDIMHIKGDLTSFSLETARFAARFVAASVGLEETALCDKVYDMVKRKMYYNIVSMLVGENIARPRGGDSREMSAWIDYAWERAQAAEKSHLDIHFETDCTLVGVGAPIHIFLPDVAKALGAVCVIPEKAAVVNAVGAVAGNVSASAKVQVKPLEMEFLVTGNTVNQVVAELEEATELACRAAEEEARARAQARGAHGELIGQTKVKPTNVRTGYGGDLYLGSEITATAIGKLRQ